MARSTSSAGSLRPRPTCSSPIPTTRSSSTRRCAGSAGDPCYASSGSGRGSRFPSNEAVLGWTEQYGNVDLDERSGAVTNKTETAILAGGCFWGVQELLRHRDGVISTRLGYTGGVNDYPTYGNHPGHAE